LSNRLRAEDALMPADKATGKPVDLPAAALAKPANLGLKLQPDHGPRSGLQ